MVAVLVMCVVAMFVSIVNMHMPVRVQVSPVMVVVMFSGAMRMPDFMASIPLEKQV